VKPVLAFDTATDVATCALLDGTNVLGERTTSAHALLVEVDALLGEQDLRPSSLHALVVGTGPGSFTSTRIGLAIARGLALALDIPAAGVSTLDALAAARAGAYPVIDARRREVFAVVDGQPAVLPPAELPVEAGKTYVGDGAVRYRELLETAGGRVPPDDSELHLPRARFHAQLARDFVLPDEVQPMYLRIPDVDRART
jgi:tRNA threonylcarbamoyladenosine biosynthesis protein TsaB